MKHRILYIPIFFLLSLSFVDCAKKGSPTGGKRDSIPPVIVKSNPENYSTSFTGTEIRVYFNEYIKLKDLQKELIISPPMKTTPNITPLSASKVLKIKISDTLKENTTYSINFGNSIVDNNEENAFEHFKYVFSTGTYIDSLTVSGKIVDAELLKAETPTTVVLYEVNDTFKDSLVFSEKPRYITTTKDSTSTFELTNIKEGKYLLLALKEKSANYTFQPKTDKIGFEKSIVSLPTDSTYTLTLFKEESAYKIALPKHETKNHLLFGFEGDATALELEILSEVPDEYQYTTYRDLKKDTIHYWFKPSFEADSLVFVAKNYDKKDTLTVRMRNLFADSLSISPINSGTLTVLDTFKITATTPLVSVDSERVQVLDKDSISVAASFVLDATYNVANIVFDKKEEQNYAIEILPGAITDFFEKTNDTLFYRVSTKPISDYGNLTLSLTNAKKFPMIVQLVNEKFVVISETYLTENKPVLFEYINPGNYYIRIVYDENGNKKWDTGNFLQRLAPEKILYYPSKIEVKANWSLNETFTLD